MPTGGRRTLSAWLVATGWPEIHARTTLTFSIAKFQYLKKPRNPRFKMTVIASMSLRRPGSFSRSTARARKKSTVDEEKISGRYLKLQWRLARNLKNSRGAVKSSRNCLKVQWG